MRLGQRRHRRGKLSARHRKSQVTLFDAMLLHCAFFKQRFHSGGILAGLAIACLRRRKRSIGMGDSRIGGIHFQRDLLFHHRKRHLCRRKLCLLSIHGSFCLIHFGTHLSIIKSCQNLPFFN